MHIWILFTRLHRWLNKSRGGLLRHWLLRDSLYHWLLLIRHHLLWRDRIQQWVLLRRWLLRIWVHLHLLRLLNLIVLLRASLHHWLLLIRLHLLRRDRIQQWVLRRRLLHDSLLR